MVNKNENKIKIILTFLMEMRESGGVLIVCVSGLDPRSNPKPTIYCSLYENTDPALQSKMSVTAYNEIRQLILLFRLIQTNNITKSKIVVTDVMYTI